jgi:hypothetical protein
VQDIALVSGSSAIKLCHSSIKYYALIINRIVSEKASTPYLLMEYGASICMAFLAIMLDTLTMRAPCVERRGKKDLVIST